MTQCREQIDEALAFWCKLEVGALCVLQPMTL